MESGYVGFFDAPYYRDLEVGADVWYETCRHAISKETCAGIIHHGVVARVVQGQGKFEYRTWSGKTWDGAENLVHRAEIVFIE